MYSTALARVDTDLNALVMPSTRADERVLRLEDCVEREAPHFLTIASIKQEPWFLESPRSRIEQSYFPEKLHQFIYDQVVPPHFWSELKKLQFRISQGRLRSEEFPSGSCIYTLGVKGKLPHFHKSERFEFTIEIGADDFQELAPLARNGSVVKERIQVNGWVRDPDGVAICCVDSLKQVAGQCHPLLSQFVLAEVEVPELSQIASLSRGEHSFEFLRKYGVNLLECDKALKKSISSTRLAKNGIDSNTAEAIAILTSRQSESLSA